MNRREFRRAILLGVGLLVAPVVVTAQGECEFEPSDAASAASEALQEVGESTPPEQETQAHMEALDALQPELDGDNAVVHLLATQVYLALERFDEALESMQRFEELGPEECQVHGETMRQNGWVRLYNRGIQSYNDGDTETALASFVMASQFSHDLRSFNNAALLQMEMGDHAAAIATYEEALTGDLTDADPEQVQNAIKGLGDLLVASGRPEEALDAYASYLEDHPDDVVIRIRYALALTEAGRADEATSIFGEVLSRDDLTPQQWVEVGVGLYNSRDFENASTAFGKAREANPYSKEAMENYVNASVQAGRPGPVIPLADTLVQWYPYDVANYQLHASALARADMDAQAMEVMTAGETTDIVFHSVQMAPASEGTYVVRGSLEARNATGEISIPFEFLDASGQVVATETLTTEAPPAGQTQTFRLEVSPGVPVAGFRYKKSGA